MFGWFTPQVPLTDDQRQWVQGRFVWLQEQFGAKRLRGPVITPTDEFFPEPYAGTVDDAAVLFKRVCGYMDVDRERVELSIYSSEADGQSGAIRNKRPQDDIDDRSYAQQGQPLRIRLDQSRLEEPLMVVAIMVRELGHVLLLGEGRCSADIPDYQPLTDLLTVYFGFGIFSANSVIHEQHWRQGRYSSWSVSKSGTMSPAHYAHALALYTELRGEHKPAWWSHLRPDILSWTKAEMRRVPSGRTLSRVSIPAFSTQPPPPPPESTEPEDLADGDGEHAEADSEQVMPADSDYDDSVGDETVENSSTREAHDDDDFDVLVPVAKGGADEWYSRGFAHAHEGEFELAVDAFSRALALKPSDIEARQGRADAYIAVGRYADAVQDCTQILEQDDGELAACVSRGKALVHLGQYAAAIVDLTTFLRANPRDFPEPYLMRGLAQLGSGDFYSALADFNQAIRYAPTWGKNYLARSRAHAALGNAREAQADLHEAIRRESQLADESLQAVRLAGVEIPDDK